MMQYACIHPSAVDAMVTALKFPPHHRTARAGRYWWFDARLNAERSSMMFQVHGDAISIMLADFGIFFVFIAMAKFLDATRSPDRILMGTTAAVAISVYAMWRFMDTLPQLAWRSSASGPTSSSCSK